MTIGTKREHSQVGSWANPAAFRQVRGLTATKCCSGRLMMASPLRVLPRGEDIEAPLFAGPFPNHTYNIGAAPLKLQDRLRPAFLLCQR